MIYPGATWRGGAAAGYARGRTPMTTAVCHYTVGRDSTGIGVQGYFNFLVRRNGEVVQFAEADALTWHAGNWNARGPGIEVEYLESYDGPAPGNIFTGPQLNACGALVRWLAGRVPLRFYDGARISEWAGFITHRSIIQSGDWHYNYWTAEQFAAMVGAAPAPAPVRRSIPAMFGRHIADGAIFLFSPARCAHIADPATVARLRFVGVPYAGDMTIADLQGWSSTWGTMGQLPSPGRAIVVRDGTLVWE